MNNLAGGQWLGQNKVRPGAYLNFISTPRPIMTIGDRGIAIIPMPLSWGDNENLITVYSTDLLDGRSLAKVGFTAFNPESKLLNLLLSNCHTALVFRADEGGIKATATLGDLTVTALFPGTLGNTIQVAIIAIDDIRFDVKTYVNAVLKNTQRVEKIDELVPNDFVEFSPTTENGVLEERAGEPLSGGEDGTVTDTTMYEKFIEAAAFARWQTMAVPIKNSEIAKDIVIFIENQRFGEGRYVQAVLCDYAEADSESIISVSQGFKMGTETISDIEAVAWVAGATAGASIVESLTGRVINGATEITPELTNGEIIEALQAGVFTFSKNQNGAVKVEQDINTLTTFTQDKNYAFSKNRIMRTLDEIGTTVKDTWENTYMGKVSNNENGRAMFRGDVISYFTMLQSLGAIQEFAGAEHVEVLQGDRLDSVVCNVTIKPVDSMEFLYMTVNVQA